MLRRAGKSPPGGAMWARPVRANRGQSRSTEPRSRPTSDRSGAWVLTCLARIRSVVVPIPSTPTPRSSSRRAMTSTSAMPGTFVRTPSPSVSRHAARSGNAAFLFPSTETRPPRRWPPSISNVDIQPPSVTSWWFVVSRREKRDVVIVGGKPDEDRLGTQVDIEPLAHGELDAMREAKDVACRGTAAIDDGQRVLRGEAHGTINVATREAALLYEPGGGNFHAVIVHQIVRGWSNPLERGAIHDGIHEERTDAARVGVCGVQDHSLPAANLPHGIPYVLHRWALNILLRQIIDDIRVCDSWRRARFQAESDLGDHETPGVFPLESAHTIGEAAVVT